eukprot:8409423-Lingulodinium_polyedra.AAC.1
MKSGACDAEVLQPQRQGWGRAVYTVTCSCFAELVLQRGAPLGAALPSSPPSRDGRLQKCCSV